MSRYTDEQAAVMGRNLGALLCMRRDKPEYPDRWRTTWGNKTDLGLWRTFERLAEEANNGKPHADLTRSDT